MNVPLSSGLTVGRSAVPRLERSIFHNYRDATPKHKSASRHLLVTVDDTQLSWKALRYTMKELYRQGDVLHLVHVIPRDMVHVPIPLSMLGNVSFTDSCVLSPEQMELALCEHAELFISQCMVDLVGSCQAHCQVDIIRTGHIRDSIVEAVCKAAERLEASLIVVPGNTPRSFADLIFRNDHAFFGAYVAEHSSRPTLIFQPERTV
ncbi:hypothetical protein CEUSTIGMA_g9377.t1 [Chlamydomonas eustigma]|uniref:UspA domain-containing protein n=1 Tax=Chlamydomonas eustigma TaxID=1157962 RepID=A0A250XGB6_9CHLO|nr:hypothetical protein CEUSTIGMA_g9377.t1 [Chlamydomonas eustigma]|eukprot:GAX81949.1 hypothetical protein CEUSTIGMA_g9377.t1 [Chlamydomonas eustigma]